MSGGDAGLSREEVFFPRVAGPRAFLDDHCANCMAELPEEAPGLFCSSWCREVAGFVRYWRRTKHDARLENPVTLQAFQIKLGFAMSGGYAQLDRTLPRSVRAEVIERDAGRCRSCGAAGSEIDHIDGSSADLGNLQLLCGPCHLAKTQEGMRSADLMERLTVLHLEMTRVRPDEPLLFADDESTWEQSWQELRKARTARFRDALLREGVDVGGVMAHRRLVAARDEWRALEAGRSAERMAPDELYDSDGREPLPAARAGAGVGMPGWTFHLDAEDDGR